MSKIETDLHNQLTENITVHQNILKISQDILQVIDDIKKKIHKGGKILFCGNGGSAADAQHLAAEFLIRLRPHISRNPIPALSLAQDTSTLTACGNDYSFDDIFLRPFQAIAKKNDVLLCISTSGNSKNILKVLKESNKKKIYSVSFLGKGGGKAKKLSNKSLIISSNNTARIQECHIMIGHIMCELIEQKIFPNENKCWT